MKSPDQHAKQYVNHPPELYDMQKGGTLVIPRGLHNSISTEYVGPLAPLFIESAQVSTITTRPHPRPHTMEQSIKARTT